MTLRPADGRDLAAIGEGGQDPDVVRWIGPAWPIDEVLDRLEELRRKGSPTWAITGSDGACLGLVCLNVAAEDASTRYVGYWLLPAARGRGLATAAVRLVTRRAIDELGTEHVRLSTASDNERSQRVAERASFRRVPPNDYRPDDRPTDVVFELPHDRD